MSTEIPGTRLTRTAWTVVLLALGTAGIMMAATALSQKDGSVEQLTIHGMALTIGCVGSCWGIVLAIRAIRLGEPTRSPLLLIGVSTLAPATYVGSYWFIDLPPRTVQFKMFIPTAALVFLPFFSLAIMSSVLILPPVVKWIDKLRIRTGMNPWSRVEHMKWGVRISVVYMFVLGCLVLPVMLCTHIFMYWQHVNNLRFIPKSSPAWANDAAESLLYLRRNWIWQNAQVNAIRHGNLSLSRLRELFDSGDKFIKDYVLINAGQYHPEWAVTKSLELLAAAEINPLNKNVYRAQIVLAKYGTDRQRRDYLRKVVSANSDQAHSFFIALSHTRRDSEMISILKKALEGYMFRREYALQTLDAWLPHDEMNVLLKETVCQSTYRSNMFVNALKSDYLDNLPVDLRAKIFLAILDIHGDDRGLAFLVISFKSDDMPPIFMEKAVSRLITHFTSSSARERCIAAKLCAQLLNMDTHITDELKLECFPTVSESSTYDDLRDRRDTENAKLATQAIREKAEAWLQEQSEHPKP